MTKRLFTIILVTAMMLCTGCAAVLLPQGTLSLDPNGIRHIEIANASTGKTFLVQNREDLDQIIRYLNSYTLDNGTDLSGDIAYTLDLVQTSGEESIRYGLSNAEQLRVDGLTYNVNTKDLFQLVRKLECDIMTDQELIESLFAGDTLQELNILDEDGKISLDKIAGLTKSCPALFELISRPTVLKSVGSSGLDTIKSYLNSDSLELQQKGEAVAEIFKEYIPALRDKIDEILENLKNN